MNDELYREELTSEKLAIIHSSDAEVCVIKLTVHIHRVALLCNTHAKKNEALVTTDCCCISHGI